jgi:tetratricopeptide (TPR) repeat protein
MHSLFSYFLVAAFGLFLAFFLTSPPELHHWRPFQMVIIPGLLLAIFYCTPAHGLPSAGGGIITLVLITMMAFILSPNIPHFFSVRVSNFLDPMDWTPADEELALRPIRRLIDEGQNGEALASLKKLLQIHKPTYEALLLKAKLLCHIGSVHDTAVTLHELIPLSHTTEQQLVVMELLATLENHLPPATNPPLAGRRHVSINHELLLFPSETTNRSSHKAIPPGAYEVEEFLHDKFLWLKLAREEWGNAESCWTAAQETALPSPSPAAPKTGLLSRISRWSESVATKIHRKPRIRLQAEARAHFKQAAQYIREENWRQALPLLQKASACDPDCYEFAYRYAQAIRRTADDATTAQAVAKIIAQSQWTASEEQMLLQVKRPLTSNQG